MKTTVKPVATTPNRKSTEPSLLAKSRSAILNGEPLNESASCLVYVSDMSFQPSYVSPNSKDLLGIAADRFVGNESIWKKIIPESEQNEVFEKFKELDRSSHICCIHRIVDDCGTPVWVSHELRRVVNNGVQRLRGIITPISCDFLSGLIEPSTISSFIHKLGNHFQLMNLAFDSLRRGAAGARDLDVIQETLDKAIAISRAVSEYSQVPVWVPALGFLDVIEAATAPQRLAFTDHQIEIEREYDLEADGLTIPGDPDLLESAVDAILRNAAEASDSGGKIKVRVTVHSPGGVRAGLELAVTDYGAGIAESNLSKVTLPFFSTKANHHGLGLSMASRFVELHGGFLKITSVIGKGTEVQVFLPLNGNVED